MLGNGITTPNLSAQYICGGGGGGGCEKWGSRCTDEEYPVVVSTSHLETIRSLDLVCLPRLMPVNTVDIVN